MSIVAKSPTPASQEEEVIKVLRDADEPVFIGFTVQEISDRLSVAIDRADLEDLLSQLVRDGSVQSQLRPKGWIYFIS